MPNSKLFRCLLMTKSEIADRVVDEKRAKRSEREAGRAGGRAGGREV
jgi:hypothetical protein